MKKLILTIMGSLLFAAGALAQTPEEPAPEGYMYVDSVMYNQIPRYNQELAGKTVYEAMPAGVKVNESINVRKAVASRVNELKGTAGEVEGFRIRIYFDNKQKSREESEAVIKKFKALYPGYNTYLKFNNPNFKVTVGDFRTRVDAQIALQAIIRNFPTAFIVKEKMRYPVINENVRVTVDTVRMLVPVPPKEEKVAE